MTSTCGILLLNLSAASKRPPKGRASSQAPRHPHHPCARKFGQLKVFDLKGAMFSAFFFSGPFSSKVNQLVNLSQAVFGHGLNLRDADLAAVKVGSN